MTVEIDQGIYDLYDEYCHGRIDPRINTMWPGYEAAQLAWTRTVEFFRKNLS